MFHASRIIITIGSLIVPALLSTIEVMCAENKNIYWVTWVVSLFVTICNALVTLFKFDKRYYYLHTIVEQLVSEGWQYIELTGKYSGFNTHGARPTHENQFVYFCHSIEKIRMKQIEEEYYKLTDSHSQYMQHPHTTIQGAPASTNPSTLIPPSPMRGDLTAISPETKSEIEQQLSHLVVESGEWDDHPKQEKKEDTPDTKDI